MPYHEHDDFDPAQHRFNLAVYARWCAKVAVFETVLMEARECLEPETLGFIQDRLSVARFERRKYEAQLRYDKNDFERRKDLPNDQQIEETVEKITQRLVAEEAEPWIAQLLTQHPVAKSDGYLKALQTRYLKIPTPREYVSSKRRKAWREEERDIQRHDPQGVGRY